MCSKDSTVDDPLSESTNNHNHDNTFDALRDAKTTSEYILAIMLDFSTAIHSIIIGIDLGILNSGGDYSTLVSLLIALIFHQLMEGIGVGSYINKQKDKFGRLKLIILVGIFALSVSIGVCIGIAISSDSGSSTQTGTHFVLSSLSCI